MFERAHDVMAKVLDCSLEISNFELQSCYYVPFRLIILGEVKLPFPPVMGKTAPLLFYKDGFGIR